MTDTPEPDLLDTAAAGPTAVRGGMVRVAGYGVGVLVTVVSAAVLFRALGVDDAGRYVVVLSIATLAAGLTDAGLSTIGVRELATRPRAQQREFLANLLGLRIAFTAAGGAVAVAYAALVIGGDAVVAGTAIAALGVLAQNLQSTYATALMASLRLGWVTAIELGRQIVTAALIVAVALAGGGLLGFLGVAPVAGALAVLATIVLVRRTVPVLPRIEPAVWRALLRQTLPFALAMAVGALYFRAAILAVDLLTSEYETGLFGASFRIVEVLIVVPQMLITAALPIFARAARDDADRFEYGVGLVAQAVVTLGAAVGVGLVAGAPVAVAVVAGPEYADAADVLRLHGVALLLSFAAAPWGYVLLSRHRHRETLVQVAVGFVVLLAALLALVPTLGARGGALATIAGELALAVAGYVLVRRAGVRVRLDWVPRLALVLGVALLPALLLPALPAVLAGELLLVAGLVLVGGIPDEVLDLLPAPLARPLRRR